MRDEQKQSTSLFAPHKLNERVAPVNVMLTHFDTFRKQ